MDVPETAVTFPFWNATVWNPPPDLGTTTVPCTAPNGPPNRPGPRRPGPRRPGPRRPGPNAKGPWCGMRHGRFLGKPLGGSGVRDGALVDGEGGALGVGVGEDEPVAATATPAPAS